MPKSPNYCLSWSYDGLRLFAMESGYTSTSSTGRRTALVFRDTPGVPQIQQDFFTKLTVRQIFKTAFERPNGSA
jgi:hypothetical protein